LSPGEDHEFKVLSPTAILGYGFPMASFHRGLEAKPSAIGVDAGSTDPGPFYLGSGACFTDRAAVKRDLRAILGAGVEARIPVVVGTAGGSGAEIHLQRDLQIIQEIAHEQKLHFRLAIIHAEVDFDRVRAALRAGTLKPAGPGAQLDEEILGSVKRIVGQMGIEPFVAALRGGADVVLAGRSYDPAVFAAPAINAGYDPGLSIHLGKILECGAIATSPGSGSDCLFGAIGREYFEVKPLNPIRKCTVTSVAAHTLYEKSNPTVLPGPGGHLDLSQTTFEQSSESGVRVTGSRFVRGERYFVKLEGVSKAGYRTISIAGCRDPFMIQSIEAVTETVRERVEENFEDFHYEYALNFTLYGKSGVMGQLERQRSASPLELGIIIEVVANTQSTADTICAFARSTMLHCSYPGRVATAGNLAFPYSPSDISAGEVYRFSVYHLLEVADPTELFPVEYLDL
jgi:hypothetical protein